MTGNKVVCSHRIIATFFISLLHNREKAGCGCMQESLSSTTMNVQEFVNAPGRVGNRCDSSMRNEFQLTLWLKDPLGTLPVRHCRLLRRWGMLLLLPPVLSTVHIDLFPPALIAAERRVPSSLQEHTHTQWLRQNQYFDNERTGVCHVMRMRTCT